MKTVIIVFAVLVVLAGLSIASLCKAATAGRCREKKEDPCVECLRWEECNGVDDGCPWRAKHGK